MSPAAYRRLTLYSRFYYHGSQFLYCRVEWACPQAAYYQTLSTMATEPSSRSSRWIRTDCGRRLGTAHRTFLRWSPEPSWFPLHSRGWKTTYIVDAWWWTVSGMTEIYWTSTASRTTASSTIHSTDVPPYAPRECRMLRIRAKQRLKECWTRTILDHPRIS